jgi:hypothetical protein
VKLLKWDRLYNKGEKKPHFPKTEILLQYNSKLKNNDFFLPREP